MSRFLKKRHYQLVLPGIRRIEQGTEEPSIQEIIMWYMDKTKVNYTLDDVAAIQTMYLQKYGHTNCTFHPDGKEIVEERRLHMESRARYDFDKLPIGRRSDVKKLIEDTIIQCRSEGLNRLSTTIRIINILAIKLEMLP